MNTTTLLTVALLLLAGGAVAMIVLGLRRPLRDVSIEERLAAYAERPVPLEELELQRPFRERVLLPLFRQWTRRIARFTPKQNVERLRQMLLEAGNPNNLGVVEFLGLRGLLGLLLGGGAFLMTLVTGTTFAPVPLPIGIGIPGILLFPLPLTVFGYLLPILWLRGQVGKRQKEMQKALPDAIDLLTISVEAGLGFDPALQRVCEKWDNALTQEFRRYLQDQRVGKPKIEALRGVAQRCAVDDLRVFISSIVQATELGVSITTTLRTQSQQMRVKRRQRAEELAHKAPIKMLFPMVFLIFPAMYVIILGPVAPTVWETLIKK